jgi:hypothetical protein
MSHPDEIPSALRVRRTAVIAAAGLSGLLVLLSISSTLPPRPTAASSSRGTPATSRGRGGTPT